MVGREIKSFCRGQWVWLGKSCLGNGLGMGLGLVGFFLGGSAARPRENGLGIWVPQVDGNAKITHENRPKSAASKYFNRTDFRRACGLTLRGGGRGGPGAAVVGGRGGLFRVGDALVRSIKSGGGCAAICRALRTYGRRVVRYCPALSSSRMRAQRSFGNRGGGSLARSRAGSGLARPRPQRSFRGWIQAGGTRGLRFKHRRAESLHELRVHGGRGQAGDAPPRRPSR